MSLLNNLKDFLRYRVWNGYTVIRIHSLEPGYWDTDKRLLHGMFDLLVDFVEVEKAHMQKIFDDTGEYKWYKRLQGWVPFMFSRDPKAGLDYLDWEIQLNDSYGQADSAREQKELYLWWKAYPNLPDPFQEWYDFQESMCNKYCNILEEINSPSLNVHKVMTEEELDEESILLKKCSNLELSRLQEEEDMLIRLIKIRLHLWT